MEIAHRDRIGLLQKAMQEFPSIELEVKHHFAHGTYTRELFVPRGTILVGKLHRNSCINLLTKGKMRVITNEGDYDIEAPYTFVSGVGIQKGGVALEDSIWVNVHPWDGKQSLEQLEHVIIAPSYEALEGPCLGLPLQ